MISEERLVVCERRGGASAGALNFFGLFSCNSRRFDAKRAGDIDRGREEVGRRKRESCRFFAFSFTVVSLQCMLSGKSDRLMKTEAFPGA
jgi:hypothetical protein